MTQALSALNPFKRPKVVNSTTVNTPITPTATQASAGRELTPGGLTSGSYISTGSSTGLSRKANTRKRSLIGGSA